MIINYKAGGAISIVYPSKDGLTNLSFGMRILPLNHPMKKQ